MTRNDDDASTAHEQPCPRLRPEVPLIWRASDRLHFGDDPTPMTMSAAEATWLNDLGSFRTWPAARSACPTGDLRAELLLARARAAQAIDEPAECWWLSPEQRAQIRPQLLALAPWHGQPDQALAARSGTAIAVQGPAQIASSIDEALRACSLRVVDPRYADIVIMASVGHVDAIDAHDEDLSNTHLPVRFQHTRVAIGPVVIPGRTPCCRCLALHLRDRDSSWPAMAAQWRTHTLMERTPIDPLLVHRGAIEVVTMLREWIDTAGLETIDRIHLEPPRMTPRRERINAHDACGCLWQRRMEIA